MSGYDNIDHFRPPKVTKQRKEDDPETRGLSIDRIMRSLVNLLNVLQDLQDCEVGLKATDQQIDLDTPTGRLMVNLLGAFAEWEKEIIGSASRTGWIKLV